MYAELTNTFSKSSLIYDISNAETLILNGEVLSVIFFSMFRMDIAPLNIEIGRYTNLAYGG